MFQPIDGEAEALRELGARVNRVRSWVAGVIGVSAMVAGVGGYVELRALQLEHWGAHIPSLTGGVTMGLALWGSFFASGRISRLLVRGRSDGWIVAARAHHQVAEIDPLRQFLAMWS